ncbi:hypothetical protein AGR9A_Lc40437 [Agrobacterium salinitolerans str. Hayward 0363]|nr:hypothetical protein AGR9A_Lc40437 [Agrobacterium salinitolerans str. Hayward 0363]
MSVVPDKPDDFVNWLVERGMADNPLLFALCGDDDRYLRYMLAGLLRIEE